MTTLSVDESTADETTRTTISVAESTADAIHARKQRGDSYDSVIRRELGLDADALANVSDGGADDHLAAVAGATGQSSAALRAAIFERVATTLAERADGRVDVEEVFRDTAADLYEQTAAAGDADE